MEKEDIVFSTRNGMLFNALYLSAKVLVRRFKSNPHMTDDEFILRMRTLLDEYELLREKAGDER